MKPQMNTDEHGSGFICTTKVQILCRLEKILLRGFFALFASSRLIPDSAGWSLRAHGAMKRPGAGASVLRAILNAPCGSTYAPPVNVRVLFSLSFARVSRYFR